MNGPEKSINIGIIPGLQPSGNMVSTPLIPAMDMETVPLPPSSDQAAATAAVDTNYYDGHHPAADSEHHHKPALMETSLETNKVYDFSSHVDCTFVKVFPESKATHSVEAVSTCMNQAFSITQQVTYVLLTVFIGTFLMVIWGFIFALLNFVIIWLIQPILKVTFLFLRLGGELTRVTVRSYVHPLFQSVGMIYSNFKGNFNVNIAAQDLTGDDLQTV